MTVWFTGLAGLVTHVAFLQNALMGTKLAQTTLYESSGYERFALWQEVSRVAPEPLLILDQPPIDNQILSSDRT